MGMIQHEALIVTSWDLKKLKTAHKRARKLFNQHNVTLITGEGMNGYESFVIVPCGSKLGWEPSNKHQEAMEEFVEYLNTFQYEDGSSSVSYVKMSYGELGLQVSNDQGIELESNETR